MLAKFKIVFSSILILSFLNLNCQNISWATAGAGNKGGSFLSSIASNNENIYAIGFVKGDEAIIQDSIIDHGNFHFLANYNINGDLKWIKEFGFSIAADLCLNSLGEIIVVMENYIRKYDSFGSLIWEKQVLENFWKKEISSVSTDANDNILISGYFEKGIMNSNPVIVEDTVLTDFGYNCKHAFVMRFNVDGRFEWINSTHGGNSADCIFRDLKTDSQNKVFVVGDFETQRSDIIGIGTQTISSNIDTIGSNTSSGKDIIIASFNNLTGELVWVKSLAGNGYDWGNKISINEDGEIHVVGTMGGFGQLPGDSINNYRTNLIYLSKLTSNGDIIWSNLEGSISSIDAGRSIITDIHGNVFIAGTAANTALFGRDDKQIEIITGNEGLMPVGFLAKYNSLGELSYLIYTTARMSGIYDLSLQGDNIIVAGDHHPRTKFLDEFLPVADSADYDENNGLYKKNFFLASINFNFTAIPTFQSYEDIILYPNPTSREISINLNEAYENCDIHFYNSNGEIVISRTNLSGHANIDLSSLPTGIYIVKIQTEYGLLTKKIIVTRN